jgi:uncharacterized protein YbaA (DUF1428 family)
MNRQLAIAVALLFGVMLPAAAQNSQAPPPTLEQLDRQRDTDNLLDNLDQLRVLADQIVKEKRAHCIRAFGHAAFCECLSSKVPVGTSFVTYIRVVTSTKEQLSYSSLSKDDKTIVDVTIAAREACVKTTTGR